MSYIEDLMTVFRHFIKNQKNKIRNLPKKLTDEVTGPARDLKGEQACLRRILQGKIPTARVARKSPLRTKRPVEILNIWIVDVYNSVIIFIIIADYCFCCQSQI